MGVVTSDLLKLVEAGVYTNFNDGLNYAIDNTIVPSIATVAKTTKKTQYYDWTGHVPRMREWTSERRLRAFNVYQHSITDKKWESSIEIDREAIEDDQYDLLFQRARDLGMEPERHKEQLVIDTLEAGFTTTCYDGQYFFDTDHSEGDSGTQSNTSSNSLTQANLQTAKAVMRAFKDDRGNPLGIQPDTLVVGPLLESVAEELLKSDVVVIREATSGGTNTRINATNYTNIQKGKYKLVVSPYITGYHWFLMDTSRSVKGIILQERSDVPIELTSMQDPNNNWATFNLDKFYWGIRGRYNAGYALWQTCYGSSASS